MPDLKTIYYSEIDSPVGSLLIAATERGLRSLQFLDERKMPKIPKPRKDELWIESREQLQIYIAELQAYFRGELKTFTFKLDLVGTEFQKKCWNALLAIPYGQTCSYADIARQVGSPAAFRAVGQANHNNPIAIVVPCHRVVTSAGTLGGYGGGLPVKEKLLRLEGAKQPQRHGDAKKTSEKSKGKKLRNGTADFSAPLFTFNTYEK